MPTEAGAEEPPRADDASISLSVTSPEDRAWPAAVEAIEFELDQAGYEVARGSPATDPSVLELLLVRDATGWELCLIDRARDRRWSASGGSDDSPQVVGVYAVELVYASSTASTVAPSSEGPAPAEATPTTPASTRPRPNPREVAAPAAAVVASRAPSTDDARRRWGIGVAVTASSLGLLGGRLDVRRQWPRFELGVSTSAGYFAMEQEYEQLDARSSQSGRGFVGLSPAAAFLFRPSRRLRPLVGVEGRFIVLTMNTRYDHFPSVEASTPDYNESRTSTGVVWAPGPFVGLEVNLDPHAALRTSLRASPVVSLVDSRLSGGGTLDLPPLDVTGTVGLAF